MKELQITATLDKLEQVQEFVRAELEMAECPMKAMMAVEVAVEELYVNIVHYAYAPESGEAVIRVCAENGKAMIRFEDGGVPFDPLKKQDADTTLSADEREIGGLGILMVKKSMDSVAYRYENGKNILTMEKTWDAS